MKTFYAFLFTVLFVPFVLSAQSDADYLKQALVNAFTKSELVNTLYDYQYRDGLASVGAFVKEDNSFTFNLYLSSSEDYVFVGGGDDDVKDIDIIVYDSDGDIVAQDNDDDANPLVNFSPSHSGVYSIKLKLISCDANGSFCVMNFMQKDGVKPSTDKLDQAINKMVKIVNYVDDEKGTKFLDREGEICFYGFAFAEDGTNSQVNGIDLNEGEKYYMLGMGDDDVNDIDLILMNSDGDKLDSDTEDDATPIITYTADDEYEGLSLKVKNIDSYSNSFVIAVILED